MTAQATPSSDATSVPPVTGLAKDPICGMVIEKSSALKLERGGRTYYFCNVNCQQAFESPEAELKAMKRRVGAQTQGRGASGRVRPAQAHPRAVIATRAGS